MEATLNARSTFSTRRALLLILVMASLFCAPASWAIDGLTPSWIIYPVALLIGLWRMRRGGGTLYFAIAATVFFLVHLPWAWTAFTGDRTSVLPEAIEIHRFEWAVTLFVIPLLTAVSGAAAWREARA